MEPITIKEAVRELRTQIAEAHRDRGDDGLIFEIEEAELQIHGGFTREIGGGTSGKLSFNVFGWGAEAGAEGSVSQGKEVSHTITLKLNVKDAQTGSEVPVNDRTDQRR